MKIRCKTAAVTAAITLWSLAPAFADVKDYEFQLVKNEAKKGEATIAVRLLNGQTVKDGDDLGIEGYHHVTVKGDVIKGAAWIDVTKENMDKYPF